MSLIYILSAFFGLFGRNTDEDDPNKVPSSVKHYMVKVQRYRRNGNYRGAERACHRALEILGTSEHSSSQAYIEGRAYVLDTVSVIVSLIKLRVTLFQHCVSA